MRSFVCTSVQTCASAECRMMAAVGNFRSQITSTGPGQHRACEWHIGWLQSAFPNRTLAGSSQRLASEWCVDWLRQAFCFQSACWLSAVGTCSGQHFAPELHVDWFRPAFCNRMLAGCSQSLTPVRHVDWLRPDFASKRHVGRLQSALDLATTC